MNTIPIFSPAVILGTDVSGSLMSMTGDCACPTWSFSPVFIEETQNLPLEETLFQAPSELLPISEKHFVLYNKVQPNRLAVLNTNAVAVWEHFREPKSTLKALKMVNPQLPWEPSVSIIRKLWAGGLLTNTSNPSIEMSVNDELIAWLHLTDRCNLRCIYCYLPHVREDMSEDIGRAAIDAVFRSAMVHTYQCVKLKYAGGEPFLRFDLIEQLHRYAQKLAARDRVKLEGIVLTNGTLLSIESVQVIQSLDLKLMISLDGLGNLHDGQRMYADGRGTFKRVADGIELARSLNLVPQISITVSGSSVQGLPHLVEWLLERKLPFSINFYRENELSKKHAELQLEEQCIIDGMLAAFDVIENNLPQYNLLNGLMDRASLSMPHRHTCGVGNNYMVFDSKGRIAQCQMHMGRAVTRIDTPDPLSAVRADRSEISNLPVEEKQGCKSCRWKYFCAGGCPLTTYRATGRYDVQSPNCNIYKTLLPEVLRLEGLRMLNAYPNTSGEKPRTNQIPQMLML